LDLKGTESKFMEKNTRQIFILYVYVTKTPMCVIFKHISMYCCSIKIIKFVIYIDVLKYKGDN